MKIGVTGGQGFIGSYICDELKKRGHTPFVLDHKGRVEHGLLGDVRDATIVMELAAHCDAIIHLAAVLGTAETIDAPLAAAETNIIGTINVFESASRYNIPVVFAAVGNANIGRGTYCITKSCGERFVNMYREDRGLQIASIRPMNAYGPRQSVPAPYGSAKVRKIVPAFICSALSGDSMRLYGGGTQISDSVFVGDVANVFVTTLERLFDGLILDHPIDVGNIKPSSVLEVAQEIAKNITGATIDAVPMRAGEPHGGAIQTHNDLLKIVDAVCGANSLLRRIDVQRTVRELGTVVSADTNTLKAVEIDANTFVTLAEGIRKTILWYRENENKVWWNPNNLN